MWVGFSVLSIPDLQMVCTRYKHEKNHIIKEAPNCFGSVVTKCMNDAGRCQLLLKQLSHTRHVQPASAATCE